jgi:hypothetical protein
MLTFCTLYTPAILHIAYVITHSAQVQLRKLHGNSTSMRPACPPCLIADYFSRCPSFVTSAMCHHISPDVKLSANHISKTSSPNLDIFVYKKQDIQIPGMSVTSHLPDTCGILDIGACMSKAYKSMGKRVGVWEKVLVCMALRRF